MKPHRLVAAMLAAAMAGIPAMTIAQQATCLISGRAGQQFAPLYTNYTVQVRDVATGNPVIAKPLDQDGRFSFANLELNQRYLVELYQTSARQTTLVCTEWPFGLAADKMTQKTDVKIECGKTPAILWLLIAGAGTASAVAVSAASGSR